MLGLVLVTHAPLGKAMLACVEHVMGAVPEGFEVVDVPADEDIELTVKTVQDAARRVHSGAGVVFLTDLFGATPSNAAVRAGMESLNLPTVLVAGCNLPMVLRALGFRNMLIQEVAERLVMGGRNGIVSTGATAPQRQTFNPAQHDDSARHHHQQ
ncbi:PTS sugar transporter subunit IIA [Limnobacter sp.]|uniref:PTS sugar transporter subunit IIA n=1 Tax=Limnobacter sp. TaxID=2003368 RepID=UPI0035136581